MTLALLTLVVVLLAVLAFHFWSARQWTAERRELVQRLQAPERAAAAYERAEARERRPKPRSIVADDDAQVRAKRRRAEEEDDGEAD